jgi:poly(3-hydroxybutyrate) depolymerase
MVYICFIHKRDMGKITYSLVGAFICMMNMNYAIDGNGNIISGGINRTFSYHAPGGSIGPNLPVMIVMHGDGGNGTGIQAVCGFDAIADANNFLVIYPDAVSGAWNRYVDDVPGDAGLGNPGAPDDVLFISDLIDHLCSTYQVNANKVYASGHSAGGFMAYHLSVMLTNKIAAFGPVSASLWGDNAFITDYFANDYVDVPVVHIHGDADFVVDYPDPDFTPVAYEEWPLSGFSSANCGNNTYISNTTVVTNVQSIIFCTGSLTEKKVELVRIMGMGHTWPNIAGFNAASYIWNFCNQYQITTGANCGSTAGLENTETQSTLMVYPVPSADVLHISGVDMNSTVVITDGSGRVVYNQENFNQSFIQVGNFPQGIYFLHIRKDEVSRTVKFIRQ